MSDLIFFLHKIQLWNNSRVILFTTEKSVCQAPINHFWRIPLNVQAISAKIFTKKLLIARKYFQCYLKHLTLIHFSNWPRDEILKHSREIREKINVKSRKNMPKTGAILFWSDMKRLFN